MTWTLNGVQEGYKFVTIAPLKGNPMLALVLLLLAVWVVIAVIGFVVHALAWLAVIAIIAFVITAVLGGLGRSRMTR